MLRFFGILRRPRLGNDGIVRRILVSYPYCNLGDLVLTLPMLEAVHKQWPDAIIDIAVRARTAELLSGIPFIGEVYQFPNWSSPVPGLTSYLRILELLSIYRRQVMHHDYDLAISARWGTDPSYGAYLMYLTGAPIRCGYTAGRDGDTDRNRLLTAVATGGEHEQEALRILRLLDRGGLRQRVHDDNAVVDAPISLLQKSTSIQQNLSLLKAIPARYAVISPGATVPRKLWPTQRFIEVMKYLAERHELAFVVVGSADDAQSCNDIVQKFPGRAVSLGGKTKLPQLIEIIRRSSLFLGNDSGPAHIAGAIGVPTVVVNFFPLSCDLEHDSSPVRFRPCGPGVAIVQPKHALPPCTPCCAMEGPHCITQISTEEAISVIEALIDDYPGRHSHDC